MRARIETAAERSGAVHVVINDFIATGGDGLAFKVRSAARRDLGIDLDATIAYLKTLPSPV